MRFPRTRAFFLLAVPMLTLPFAHGQNVKVPDLTAGEKIPDGYTHDWTLGATGLRGWIFSDKLETTKARQIAVTRVAPGSPADGLLEVGDVILGVNGKAFAYDPRTEFGKALTASEASTGDLVLTRWRDQKTEDVTLKLAVLGTYSPTAPYQCPKSKLILERGCEALAKRIAAGNERQNPVSRSLNALALLASGEKKYLPIIKKEVEWASEFSENGMQTWYYGYVITLLAEYQIATNDRTFEKGLRRLALESANGQSIVGSWGHKFAGPDGRLLGYGMMNAPGLPLTTSLIIARKAGLNDPAIDRAIDRSAKLLRFYIGKGSIPYGDHHPWTEGHEDNGKNSMSAVLFDLLEEKEGTQYFARMSTAAHGGERDAGHTGNFWNIGWAMPGISRGGPHATGAWMQEYGAWYFDLARSWDFSFPHQGPPEPKRDSTGNWDATGAYLLAYALPLKNLILTGKKPSAIPPFDRETAERLVRDGRGWSQGNKYEAYDQLNEEILFSLLSSWSPIVRERAATALNRAGKTAPIPALVKLLASPSLYSRLGACQALEKQGSKAAPAIPALRQALKSDDLWLRIKAADALAAIGTEALPVAPDLLKMLIKGPSPEDPRGMEQRYLSFALFNSRGGLLGRNVESVDRDLLLQAVRAGLQNQDGRARGSFDSVYKNLSFKDLEPLLPVIHEAILVPSPSGIMFADQIQTSGLELFTRNRVDEGIELLAYYARHQKPHASQIRIVAIMEMLKTYGAHAQRVIPQLEKTIHYFENDEPDFPKRLSLDKAQVVREAIAFIKASKDRPTLVKLGMKSPFK